MLASRCLLCVIFLTSPLLSQQRQQVVDGDMLFRPEASFTGQTPARLWTNNTVPYVIDPDIPDPARITDGFTYYNQNTLIRFQPRAGEANYVHLVRSTLGNGV